MTDTNWNPGETGVTIKTGKAYDDSWYTFRGTPESIKEQIVSFFGFDSASVASLTVHEVSVNARQVAQGVAAVAVTLGGTAIGSVPSGDGAAAQAAALGTAPASDPWAGTESAAATPAGEHPLLARINAAATTDELKLLWADNQAAFGDEAVMAAWKARGKALQAAA